MILTKEQVEGLGNEAFRLGLYYSEIKKIFKSHEALRSALDIAMGALKEINPMFTMRGFGDCYCYEPDLEGRACFGCAGKTVREALAQLDKVLNEGETK